MPLFDQFPLTVHSPEGDYYEARVIEVGGEALIFRHDGVTPYLAKRVRLTESPDPRRILRFLRTDQGGWAVEPAGGCGCRHPLKRTAQSTLLDMAGLTVG